MKKHRLSAFILKYRKLVYRKLVVCVLVNIFVNNDFRLIATIKDIK